MEAFILSDDDNEDYNDLEEDVFVDPGFTPEEYYSDEENADCNIPETPGNAKSSAKSTFDSTSIDISHQILLREKAFRIYFDQSERRNEFLTLEKIVSSNHKPRCKRIVFSRAFSRSWRIALAGSFDKKIFSLYSSCSFLRMAESQYV